MFTSRRGLLGMVCAMVLGLLGGLFPTKLRASEVARHTVPMVFGVAGTRYRPYLASLGPGALDGRKVLLKRVPNDHPHAVAIFTRTDAGMIQIGFMPAWVAEHLASTIPPQGQWGTLQHTVKKTRPGQDWAFHAMWVQIDAPADRVARLHEMRGSGEVIGGEPGNRFDTLEHHYYTNVASDLITEGRYAA